MKTARKQSLLIEGQDFPFLPQAASRPTSDWVTACKAFWKPYPHSKASPQQFCRTLNLLPHVTLWLKQSAYV